MVKSMYAGVAGLKAHQQKMDVIGNNIANVNTWGFKSANVSFKESLYQSVINASAGSIDANRFGGKNASMVGYGTAVASISSNFAQGSYAPTGVALHSMINGPGFFMVGPAPDATGTKPSNDLYMSRVGDFETKVIVENGVERTYLTDSQGYFIYGMSAPEQVGADPTTPEDLEIANNANAGQYAPIAFPTQDAAGDPISYKSVAIDANGVLTATTESGESLVVGRVVIASVPNPNGMSKTEGAYYEITSTSGNAVPVDCGGVTGKLETGGLEMASVDLSTEFSNMITTQRGFQANSKIITVTDEMLQELVNMKR